MREIYLDYNATSPLAPAVREAMLPYLTESWGNPSSGYAAGRYARQAVERARGSLAALLGARVDEIVFTSGGTESNNLAIQGGVLARAPLGRGHLVISALEHPATVAPSRFLTRLGYRLTVVRSRSDGVVDPEEVAAALRPDTVLVSIMHANNEIGTIQPLAQIAEHCRRAGVLLHSDAAQSVGKIPVRVDELGVDLLSIAGHKFHAPKGVGALYIRTGTAVEPVLHGAGQERGFRPGTEAVAQAVALGEAASLAAANLASAARQMAGQRDRLLERLRGAIGRGMSVNGEAAPRLPNTLSINFHEVSGAELLDGCPGLCASTGAACHSGQNLISATLAAIGLDEPTARGTIRLSVGRPTTEAEIDTAAQWLIESWRRLR